VALTVGLSLVVLVSFAALAVDLGYARMVDVELQNAADAAAHAAVQRLDGTDAGLVAARAIAVEVAAENAAAGTRVVLDPNVANAEDGGLVLGVWDGSTFTPSADAAQINAARAHTQVPTLTTFFARVFGQREVAVGARSTMVAEHGGASEVECVLPLAIPDCLIGYHGGLSELTDVELGLSPAGVDSVGWGRPNGNPNASWSRDQILDCENSGEAAVGDPVGLQNGVATSAMAALVTAISTSSTTWRDDTWGDQPDRMRGSDVPANKYGRTFEGPLMVFSGGDEYCTGNGGSFTGTETIVGFMWGSVYDVKLPGNGRGNGTVGTLKLRLDPMGDYDFGTAGGGPDWGVVGSTPPRMVQ
jgi:hypothetical protein